MCFCVNAQEKVDHTSVKVNTDRAYSAEQIFNAAKDTYFLDSSMLEDSSWVFMSVNTEDFLQVSTGSELMDLLYPSGLRLSTMLLDPKDAICTDSDYNPFYYGDEAKLLRMLVPDRANFTYSEVKAAAKYYRMIQAKSIALDLPVFSFQEEFSGNYSKDLIAKFRKSVELYESTFGPIGFPDTSGQSFDWVTFVKDNYQIDLSSMLITSKEVSDYRIPSGTNTISLLSNYNNGVLSEEQQITVYDSESISKRLKEDVLADYSYEVQQAYMLACEYMPAVISNYNQLYSDIYIDSKTGIQTLADYYSLQDSGKNELESSSSLENEQKKYSDDPYIQALHNQKKSSISAATIDSWKKDNNTLPTIFHGICIAIVIIAIIAAILTRIISYLRNR